VSNTKHKPEVIAYWQRIHDSFMSGKKLREIAEEYGCTVRRIEKILSDYRDFKLLEESRQEMDS
jgi:hypothetical protein